VVAVVALVLLSLGAVIAGCLAWWITRRAEGRTFSAGDVRLHFTDEGAGTPVVLLHGFAVNADLNWRLPGVTQALSRNHRVIALDLRGHGLSDKPHDPERYGFAMAQDVIELLDHLGIAEALESGRGVPPLSASLGGSREPPGWLHH
jgi:pimeloyl-ACP methyl ester carboxylesterase